jgi:thioredoxin 1
MVLRLKLFVVTAVALTLFYFILLSADYRNALAQTPSDGVKVTFVEIGSVNCIPCKAMQPIMKAVEEEYKGQVKIVFHDVWTPKGKADAMKYNIRFIPTQIFLDKDGKEYFRHEGFFPKDEVVKVIKMKGVK